MFKISEELAQTLNVHMLVTGESIGQVASQTITNLSSIDNRTNLLVLRPVIGMDKVEIINKAKEIGTYQISKVNCPDSCTVFAPKKPATTSHIERLKNEESTIDFDDLLKSSVDNIERIKV